MRKPLLRAAVSPPLDPESEPTRKPSPNIAASAENPASPVFRSRVAKSSSATLKRPAKKSSDAEASTTTRIARRPESTFKPSRASRSKELGSRESETRPGAAPNDRRVRTSADTAKVPAFTPRIASGPATKRMAAAIAGPAVKPTSAIAPYSEVAVGSRRVLTRLGIEASAAGVNSPVPIPARTASASVPAKPSTATMPAKAIARTRSATTRQVRRDQRSAAAPNTGPSNIAGARSAMRMRLIAHGERKRSYAISRSATYAAPVPRADWARVAK